jgi:cytosine/adenosine deaminase-related metal-dependent hydrolase
MAMVKRHLLLILLLAVPAWAHGTLKLTNGLWWNGHAFEEKTMYSVENVFRETLSGEVTKTIDLGHRYIVPPYADAHNHVFADGMNIDQQLRQYLRLGIFYVKNPNSTIRLSVPVRDRLNRVETVDVVYSFGGITAPGGHPVQIYDSNAGRGGFAGWTASDMADQAYFIVGSEEDLNKKWPLILAAKPDFIKTYLDHSEEFAARRDDPSFYGRRGLDPRLLTTIVKRAHAAGLRVTTHIATAADFRNAVAAGADELAHLPLERITADDARAAAAAHVTVVTTTLSHRPTGGITDLDGILRDNLRLLRSAGAHLALGTDNGERTVVDEADNVRRLTQWTNSEVLNLLTDDTSRQVFPARKIGRLADGFEASLLAIDGNPLSDWTAIRRVALRIKQGHVLEVPPEKPSVAAALLPIALERGANAATEEYARLLREQSDKFEFGEAEINRLGYELLRREKFPDAILVFDYNTKLFPSSANAWDSLAEGYMRSGDRDRAIANYRKSIELNPQNRNAAAMLQKLGAAPP